MPSAPPDKLSFVVQSGWFDKVHYALVMASAAAAVGTPATLFFTMGACRALLPAKGDTPGWAAMPIEGKDQTAADYDRAFGERGVAQFEEMLDACVALGIDFMVCEMGLRAMDMTRADLRDDVPLKEGGVVTFLNDASKDGTVIFV